MNQLTRDGFILSYSIEGQGPTAIVIGSATYYPRTYSENLRKHLRMVFIDHRGFGKAPESYSESDYSLDVIADDIEALRQSLGENKVIIIGHSGHAHMAMAYAIKYPEHVSHLVLIGISPKEDIEAANQYFEQTASPERKALFAQNMQNLKDGFVNWMVSFGPMIWYQHDYDATNLWKDVKINADIFDHLWGKVFKEIDIANGASKIQAPVFIALGRYDYFNPPYLWDAVTDKFNDITVHIFEKSAHTPQMEDPECFDTELLKFIIGS